MNFVCVLHDFSLYTLDNDWPISLGRKIRSCWKQVFKNMTMNFQCRNMRNIEMPWVRCILVNRLITRLCGKKWCNWNGKENIENIIYDTKSDSPWTLHDFGIWKKRQTGKSDKQLAIANFEFGLRCSRFLPACTLTHRLFLRQSMLTLCDFKISARRKARRTSRGTQWKLFFRSFSLHT